MKKVIFGLRILGVVAVSIFGWFVMAGFRTTQFGNDFFVLLVLLMGFLFVFPLTPLPFIGLKPKQFVISTLGLFFVIFTFSIIWATTEETLVVKKYDKPSKNLVVNRAWPFQQHVIFHDGMGWAGQD